MYNGCAALVNNKTLKQMLFYFFLLFLLSFDVSGFKKTTFVYLTILQ